ncbi:PEP/pyruvate-binding domain-containing protein [Escherichia coli]|uniref:PEP/pyruvate-binding domain-containing protein n=1 Tax=Escherichia coli TaxID=562 RepID=UPI003EE1A02B
MSNNGSSPLVLWYNQLGMNDVDRVGGKNASLGEMITNLSGMGVSVPNGFATTADAFNQFLDQSGVNQRIYELLDKTDIDDVTQLAKAGAQIRQWIIDTPFQPELENAIREAYAQLSADDENASFAVRSSATAEDMPDASFAGQQETFLNVQGVMLTHNNILASERAYCARLNLTWQDVFMMPAPLGHATGFLHGVTAPFLIGARSVLLDIFTPDACLALLEQQRCTCMLGATPFVYDLLNLLEKQPADLSALRFFLCGGTTIPKKVARECQQRGIKLLSVYGSTESSPHAVVNLDDPLPRFMHTDGYAAAGVEIKVVDDARKTLPPGCEGEEASRGPNVFMGYFDEPELTARALDEEGWYYSGDLCRMDEAGYIKITGRKKDIIVRGGENISSREVEDILLQHPKIHDACVVAWPDERLGERSCAYFVLKAPHHSLSLEEVVAFFSRKRVAKYKYPEHIVVIEKLPRTVSGKIQKFLLRKDIMRRLTQDVCEEIE